jgi:hypothetical protein
MKYIEVSTDSAKIFDPIKGYVAPVTYMYITGSQIAIQKLETPSETGLFDTKC